MSENKIWNHILRSYCLHHKNKYRCWNCNNSHTRQPV